MTLLSLHDLSVSIGEARPVDGVTLSVAAGEMLGIVGESGSGKSLTLKAVLRLLPTAATIGGQVLWQRQDIAALPEPAMRAIRGRDIAMVFQEPMTALNPVLTVGLQITESLAAHLGLRGAAPPSCSIWSASPMRDAGCAAIRTSFPAGCASAR
jgi:peptide/nickel transport system ATP-binding protein